MGSTPVSLEHESEAALDTCSPKVGRGTPFSHFSFITVSHFLSHFSLLHFLSPVCSYFSLARYSLSIESLSHLFHLALLFFAPFLSHPQYTECLWEDGTEMLHKPLKTVNSVRILDAHLSVKPCWHLNSHAVLCSVWNYRLISSPPTAALQLPRMKYIVWLIAFVHKHSGTDKNTN